MDETQQPANVTRADFLQKALQKASNNGGEAKLDTTVAVANLALTVVDLQKENKNLVNAIQMLSQSMGQLMEAHNRLAKHVEDKIGGTQTPEPPVAA